jgi:hypothetical protein
MLNNTSKTFYYPLSFVPEVYFVFNSHYLICNQVLDNRKCFERYAAGVKFCVLLVLIHC